MEEGTESGQSAEAEGGKKERNKKSVYRQFSGGSQHGHRQNMHSKRLSRKRLLIVHVKTGSSSRGIHPNSVSSPASADYRPVKITACLPSSQPSHWVVRSKLSWSWCQPAPKGVHMVALCTWFRQHLQVTKLGTKREISRCHPFGGKQSSLGLLCSGFCHQLLADGTFCCHAPHCMCSPRHY